MSIFSRDQLAGAVLLCALGAGSMAHAVTWTYSSAGPVTSGGLSATATVDGAARAAHGVVVTAPGAPTILCRLPRTGRSPHRLEA